MKLNPKSITDEMLALSALRSATAPAHADTCRLLTCDDLPGLRVIMRMVFAEIMLELAPHIDSCLIDSETPSATTPYSDDEPLCLEATFNTGGKWPTGMELTVKRHLEHMVAAGTLGWIASETDSTFATTLQTQREGALAALKDTLNETAAPFTRAPWP